jgi:hypothetical protein
LDAAASKLAPSIDDTKVSHLERARRLGWHLRVQVAIDDTGWLRSEIELVFTKNPDGTLRPLKVRVGWEASDEQVLAHGGVVARCAQYNGEVRRLRQLGKRLDELVRGRIILPHGSPIAYAHSALSPSRLDALIAERQESCMGHGTCRLAWLLREIEFFRRYDAQFAPIVLAAEQRVVSPPQLTGRRLRWVLRSLARIGSTAQRLLSLLITKQHDRIRKSRQ